MTRTTLIAALLSLLASSLPAPAEVLLLGTGALVEGQIDRRPDRVILRSPGVEMLLRPEEVLCVAQSPVEVYEWLRRERVADADGHLSLANWAIENKLWPQAARELLDARQADPRSPRLAILERRLDELSRPVETIPATKVVVAGPEEAREPPAEEMLEAAPLPEFPPGSLEHFTRKIQPLLRNGCASCHRGDEQDPLGLDPRWIRGRSSARSTDHNLRATLKQIDLGSPAASRLLAAVRGPHHGASPFRGPRRDELIAKLEDWVYGLAAMNPQSVTPPLPVSEAHAKPAAVAHHEAPRYPVQPAGYEDPEFEPLDRKASPPRRGVQLRRVEPRDEFDPAIFNERFRRPKDDA